MHLGQINWGIIGCGNVTEIKSGPAFGKIKNSALIAVMRRNTEKAKDYAKRHNVPKWYDNADRLIHDPDINAVYIATPPNYHAYYTYKAAEAGKHVYVEKPMALNYKECQNMINACEKANVKLFVAYYRRRLTYFNKVKELIDSGSIGKIRFVNLRLYQPAGNAEAEEYELPWRVIPEISGGGLFFDLGSHQLDILDHFFGPIEFVNGIAENQADLYPGEDIVCANFRFKSGVIGNALWCFTISDKSKRDKIEIVGDKGEIIFNTFNYTPIILTCNSVSKEYKYKRPVHIQQDLIQSIVDELQGKNKCPSDGYSAARTSWVMEEITKSFKSILNN